MNAFACVECGKDSGDSLVCRDCIPNLSTHKRQKYRAAWHRIIVEGAGNACEDCGHSAEFNSGELCGDHVQTVGSRPDLQFDVTNGRSVCLPCHNKRHSQGLPAKKGEPEKRPKFKKQSVCTVLGCPIFAAGMGFKKPKNCWKHQ